MTPLNEEPQTNELNEHDRSGAIAGIEEHLRPWLGLGLLTEAQLGAILADVARVPLTDADDYFERCVLVVVARIHDVIAENVLMAAKAERTVAQLRAWRLDTRGVH